MAELSVWRSYTNGTVVYEDGRAASEIWVVVDGCVSIGEKATVFGPGACIGEKVGFKLHSGADFLY